MQTIAEHKKTIITVTAIIAVILLGALISYVFHSRDPISSFVKKFYPAAVVGGNIISVNEAETALDIAKKLDNKSTFDQSFKQVLRTYQYKTLVGKYSLENQVNPPDEFTFLTKGKTEEYNTLLKNYFYGNEDAFYRYMVYPSAYEGALRVHYNSMRSGANQKAYDKASDVLEQIKSGEAFDDVARIQSDDEYTGQIGGDLGFFEHGQILPELEREITISALGEVKDTIVPSRLGYHVVYPVEVSVENNKKLWHAKHILIETNGFEEWFDNESSQVRTWKLLK